MNIGIIGAGHVGGNLGKIWAKVGHKIVFGVRDLQSPKIRELIKSIGSNACAGSIAEAAVFGEVVAVPWTAAKDAIQQAESLNGKILVDCTNPLNPDLSSLLIGHTTSAAEKIAQWAIGAKVVKAFNSLGAGNLPNLQFGAQKADTFICGDDAESKSVVTRLAKDIGFDVIDAGSLSSARLLEPLAMLWIQLAYKQGMGTDIAFKLLRR